MLPCDLPVRFAGNIANFYFIDEEVEVHKRWASELSSSTFSGIHTMTEVVSPVYCGLLLPSLLSGSRTEAILQP